MYWFFHEYLDEERRFRIFRVEADTENEARKLHRHACEFRWVTAHIEPSVSSLMTKGDVGVRTLAPGHRPGQPYSAEYRTVPCPKDVRDKIVGLKMGNVTVMEPS
jgi:hypothetical protein